MDEQEQNLSEIKSLLEKKMLKCPKTIIEPTEERFVQLRKNMERELMKLKYQVNLQRLNKLLNEAEERLQIASEKFAGEEDAKSKLSKIQVCSVFFISRTLQDNFNNAFQTEFLIPQIRRNLERTRAFLFCLLFRYCKKSINLQELFNDSTD